MIDKRGIQRVDYKIIIDYNAETSVVQNARDGGNCTNIPHMDRQAVCIINVTNNIKIV